MKRDELQEIGMEKPLKNRRARIFAMSPPVFTEAGLFLDHPSIVFLKRRHKRQPHLVTWCNSQTQM